jgi:DNA polymerase-3 subunit delta
VKASRAEAERALDTPPAHVRLFLLYGPDTSESLALAQRLERAMGPNAERIDLDGSTLRADPARLADEAAAISLFGDRRHIRVTVNAEEANAAIEALLDAPAAGNPVVVLAGPLRPASPLLKRALYDPAVIACVSYPLEGDRASALASALAREHGLRLDGDLPRSIAAAAGNDRALMTREIEKLSLYLDTAPDRPGAADHAAFEAVGAGEGEADLARFVDAVLGGNPEAAAREMARMAAEGATGIAAIRAISRRVQLLLKLAAAMAEGASREAVMNAQGKAIFWKDKPSVDRQLIRWTPERLARLSDRLLAAERAIKAQASAGEMLAEAEFITIARAAQRAR